MELLAARPLADRAITFELADAVGPAAAARVSAGHRVLSQLLEAGALPGARELSRSFCSITLHYDPLEGRQSEIIAKASAALRAAQPDAAQAGRIWRLPCCYDGADLEELAQRLGVAAATIAAHHAETEFTVYAIGFLPGLPFMGDLPAGFSVPRRTTPRTRVPAGSVAIANGLTVIYPSESPGGWHIVGHCPVPLFDPGAAVPALLAAGDRVRFDPVSRAESDAIAAEAAAGRLDPFGFEAAP